MEPPMISAAEIYRRHRNEQKTAQEAALERLRLAVQAGDIDAMESAYTGTGGFHIGLQSVKDSPEYLVLFETMFNDAVPLQVLGVFFRKLGGRFALDNDMCVYTVLMDIDDYYFRYSARKEERWSARMNAVVRYLVEELGFPIREQQVMKAALDFTRAACYFAFAQFAKAPVSEAAFLNRIVRKREGYRPANHYWVEKLSVELGEETLHVIENDEESHGFLPCADDKLRKRIGLAISHVRETQQKMELMLAGKRHENEALRRVMGNENLALMICGMAFDAKPRIRFYEL
jgi:hypothetical protein